MRSWLGLLSLSLLLFVGACSNKPTLPPRPESVLDKDKMVEVLVEVHLIEGTLQRRLIRGSNPNYFGSLQYLLMFERQGITKETFEESYEFYLAYPKEMTKLYERVIQELSKMESEIGKAKPKEETATETGAEQSPDGNKQQ